MKSSNSKIHKAFKQQAAMDIERMKRRYPTEEEMAAAPPPTPEAAAELEQMFADFRQTCENRDIARELLNSDRDIPVLGYSTGKRRRGFKTLMAIAACLALILGGYTSACAFTAWKTGREFVNVFCDGYVIAKKDDGNEVSSTAVNSTYQKDMENWLKANKLSGLYMPTKMLESYSPDTVNTSGDKIKIVFLSSIEGTGELSFYQMEEMTVSHDTDVDRSLKISRNGIEYIYIIKYSEEYAFQKILWSQNNHHFYITLSSPIEKIPTDDAIIRVATSIKYYP